MFHNNRQACVLLCSGQKSYKRIIMCGFSSYYKTYLGLCALNFSVILPLRMGIKSRKYLMHAILINAHLCGIIGMISPYRDLFLSVTPFNLILSTIILYYHHNDFNKPFWVFSILIFWGGFFLEVVGVKTAQVFGEYYYGKTLGLKWLDVPLVMGLNWLTLIYSAGVILNKIKLHFVIKSLIGAALLVGLDIFIEPIAIRFDFWTWSAPSVPLQNYIAWYIAAFVFLCLFYKLEFNKSNKIALTFLLVQFGFFAILNLL